MSIALRARNDQRGQLLLVVFLASIGVFMLLTLASWSITENRAALSRQAAEQALEMAESGVNYYRWHLAHDATDFQDGTGQPGPYVHEYYDRLGNLVGTYTLHITPPATGSTIVTVTSTGASVIAPNTKRAIQATFAKASLVKYAVVANDNMRFGTGTVVTGPIQSNGGIRFDGIAHNIVSSSKTCYDDPDTSTVNACERPGVWTSQPDPSIVFLAGTSFPVPAVDFTGLSSDLANIKTLAQSGGQYLAPSGSLGYHLVLNSNGTVTVTTVTSTQSKPYGCGSSTWSIKNESSATTSPLPANGLIFVEDDVWVDGTLNNARLTIASAVFPQNPSTYTSITINASLTYAHADGSESLGLIAQKDINVGLYSANNLTIDGALVAQNGRVGRFYYNSSCGSNYIRSTITLLGMIATNQRYGFAYTDGTGYQIRNLNYDGNLKYNPPPNFPLTTDAYDLLSWKEITPS